MWLLEQEAFINFQEVMKSVDAPAEDIKAFEIAASERDPMGRAQVVGSEGVIPINGILTSKPDYYARYYGGGNAIYGEISAAVRAFDADPRVTSITLDFGSSPGGNISGLFGTIEAIQSAKKPVTARVESMAASAAYALAASADKVYAADKSTMVGSVGVIQRFYVDDNEVAVTSTQAPKKAPDVSTPEGRGAVREVLDGVHALFAGAIATGRGVTEAVVNSDFGQGAVVLAGDAVKKGMIDKVGNNKPAATTPSNTQASSKTDEEIEMDITKLQLEHPALFAEVKELGTAQERDRVTAHVNMGEQSGDMKTMLGAIRDGSGMTMTLQSVYQGAFMRKMEMEARQGENPDVTVTPDGDGSGGKGKSEADIVADGVAEMMGADDIDADDMEV